MNQPASDACSNLQQSICQSFKGMMQEIAYHDFKEVLDAYVQSTSAQMRLASWFNGSAPSEKFLELNSDQYHVVGEHNLSSHFVPFVQKLVIKPGSKVIAVGDLHGDLDALLALLSELEQTGYLDSNFNLLRSDVYIVFLGDYVNRGADSVGVMYLLSKLAVANTGHVFLIRGNHEYSTTSKYFDKRVTDQQDQTSSYPVKATLLQELGQRFAGYAYPELLYWFDYLPAALYLGTPDASGLINYVKFCHAGLELGYNPSNFLASNASHFMLEQIDRYQAFEQLEQELTHVAVAINRSREVAQTVDDCDSKITTHELYFKAEPVNFSHPMTLRHIFLGFQWDNFLTQDNDSIDFAVSVKKKRVYLGKKITQHILNKRSSQKVAVRGIVRGHQHLDEVIPELDLNSPMLSHIRQQAGVVKQWDGMVYTLGASDSITGYHSFVMIQTHEDVLQWSLRHYFKKPDQESFFIRMSTFLG